ncbi:hypothetical protein E0Z10_g2043 [Xylaria hypoxylon]|uniref:RRM domain-containing protein n=1 Tax=Xylaria hypoxylon TaxID=37992 RepID=A0A4Z0YQS5_9PEZI|nr:hypothetical protein E0Z10_g2043 [Xylaria hypoxylon]
MAKRQFEDDHTAWGVASISHPRLLLPPILNQSVPSNQPTTGTQYEFSSVSHVAVANRAGFGEFDQFTTDTRHGLGGTGHVAATSQVGFGGHYQGMAGIQSEPSNDHEFDQESQAPCSFQYRSGAVIRAIGPQCDFGVRNGYGLLDQGANGTQDSASTQNVARVQHETGIQYGTHAGNQHGVGIQYYADVQYYSDIQSGTGIIGTQNDTSIRHEEIGASQPLNKHVGSFANLQNGLAFATDPNNTCVWITELPPNCTLKNLFHALAGCGKIFSAIVSGIDRSHKHVVATVAFWNLGGVKRLMERVKEGLFIVKGRKPTVTMNRITGRSQEKSDKSRVVVIGGPNSIVNRTYMEACVFELSNEVEDVITLDYDDWRSLEYRFASVGQAEKAMKAIRWFKRRPDVSLAEQNSRESVQIRFEIDPCEETLGH